MASGCRLALLLLLWTGTWAQSGDGDAEAEPRIRCTSDISSEGNILSCELLGGPNRNEDDEDSERDGIESMSVCYTNYEAAQQLKCETSLGNAISPEMRPVSNFNLTVRLKRGGSVTAALNLLQIVKPRRPSVQNVTFNLDSNQAVISIRTPYRDDFLKVDNQLFQLHICTAGTEMTQNVSASDHMTVDMQNLRRDTAYGVKVRAMPINHLQGSWSEWSDTFSFTSPAEEKAPQGGYVLTVCLVSLVAVTVSAGVLWKNKIFSYMWPSIPHPKHTLVQICQPSKGLLWNFSPEVFSALNVYPLETAEAGEEPEPSAAPAATEATQPVQPSSTQSSDCRSTSSVSTEELELSALLSRSCSDGEESLQSSGPPPIAVPTPWDGHAPQPDRGGGENRVEVFGAGQQEEAYVTMSSFYQVK